MVRRGLPPRRPSPRWLSESDLVRLRNDLPTGTGPVILGVLSPLGDRFLAFRQSLSRNRSLVAREGSPVHLPDDLRRFGGRPLPAILRLIGVCLLRDHQAQLAL